MTRPIPVNITSNHYFQDGRGKTPDREQWKTLADLYAKARADEDSETCKAISLLARSFVPKQPRKPKTAFQWVAQATAEATSRYSIRHVYCTGALWVATNGNILFVAKAEEEHEVGYYCPKTGEHLPDESVSFPPWERITGGSYTHTITCGALVLIEPASPDPKLKPEYAYGIIESNETQEHWRYAIPKRSYDFATSQGLPSSMRQTSASGSIRLDFTDGRIAILMPMPRATKPETA